MRINIFGMGYVGCVSAACLANSGHTVTGIDVDALKVELINQGRSPIVEPGLQEALGQAVAAGKLRAAVNDVVAAPADLSIVCVGTPSNENGSLRLDYILRVTQQIGQYLGHNQSYHVVNFRSTMLPGTIQERLIPVLEKHSGKKAGADFGVCMNPEFMRESTSIRDYYQPPFTVIGERDQKSGDVVAKIYRNVDAPMIRTTLKVAEILKYACNAFHALKISFANEIGNLCKRLNIDSHEVMDIFCRDTKLNLSPYYLKPGYAFGGSCLPKDLRALLYKAKELDLESPVLSSVLRSNQNQIETAYKLVRKTSRKKVGFLGLSFKPGTDDLRESPVVELIERLIGKGYSISIYDKEVSMAGIVGSNRVYIEQAIPHVSSLMKATAREVVDDAEVVVVGNKSEEHEKVIAELNHNTIIIDLVRLVENPEKRDGYYDGICW